MSLVSFLTALFEEGCVELSEFAPLADGERVAAGKWLAEFEAQYRLSLAGSPPALDLERALAAAEAIYRACQCLVHRQLDPRELLAPALVPDAGRRSPEVHYSVDLAYRFLPEIWRLSREMAPNDPLVACVRELAARWPLSSVGIAGLTACDIEEFVGDRSLLTLYVDRILERRDRSRLDDPRVRSAVQEACGLYLDLAPELTAMIAGKLTTIESPA